MRLLRPIAAVLRSPLSLALGVILATAASAGAAGGAHAIRPGYWDYTTTTIIPGGSEGRQCVRPEQIDEFMSGPHNKHYHCTYPVKHVGERQASFDGECVSKHGQRYKIAVAGTYSETRFTLKGKVAGAVMGLPLSAPIAIDAKWLGSECPADAK